MKKIFLLLVLIMIPIIWFWRSDISVETLKVNYAKPPSAFLDVLGMQVHYRDQGSPSDTIPVILIHGTGASLHTWEGWVQKLSSQHRVISLDLPAYGLTGPMQSQNYSLESYALFLDAFLQKMQIKKCILVGNSLGGAIACKYSLMYPNTVRKLLLVDAAGMSTKSKSVPIAFKLAKIPFLKNLVRYITPRSIIESSIKNVYFDQTLVTDELVDRYMNLSLREGNRQAFVDKMGAKITPIEPFIKDIKCPVLLLWGKYDRLIPLESAYKFQKALPNDSLIVLDKMGHVPMEENPSRSFDAVKYFFE